MVRYSFQTIDGPDKGKTFELETGVTFLGRRDAPGSDEPPNSRRWILTDPAVSRTHARIDWNGTDAPVLIHLSSTNATLLDGRIVTGESIADGQSLQHGHKLRLGQTTFMLEVEELADVAEPVPSSESSGPGIWCLAEPGDEGQRHFVAESQELELDGIRIRCQSEPERLEATLLEDAAEAYVIRELDGQFWTTRIKSQSALLLQPRDWVRTESRKLELLPQED